MEGKQSPLNTDKCLFMKCSSGIKNSHQYPSLRYPTIFPDTLHYFHLSHKPFRRLSPTSLTTAVTSIPHDTIAKPSISAHHRSIIARVAVEQTCRLDWCWWHVPWRCSAVVASRRVTVGASRVRSGLARVTGHECCQGGVKKELQSDGRSYKAREYHVYRGWWELEMMIFSQRSSVVR